jgi:hypothetical protein
MILISSNKNHHNRMEMLAPINTKKSVILIIRDNYSYLCIYFITAIANIIIVIICYVIQKWIISMFTLWWMQYKYRIVVIIQHHRCHAYLFHRHLQQCLHWFCFCNINSFNFILYNKLLIGIIDFKFGHQNEKSISTITMIINLNVFT